MTEQQVRMPRGWRAVPVPKALDHLEREGRGFPVPYVAEYMGKISVCSADPSTDEVEWPWLASGCTCEKGHGKPNLGEQCPMRQRECMLNRLCQVCGKGIPEGLLAFVGGVGLHFYVEPPLHLECAAYAIQVCPGIARRPGVRVLVTEDYDLEGDWSNGDHSWVAPLGEVPLAVTLGIIAVLTFYRATPIDPDTYTVEQFLTLNPIKEA